MKLFSTNKLIKTIACLVLLLSSAQAKPINNPVPFVIPALQEWQGSSGMFKLLPKTSLVIDPQYAQQLLPFIQTFQEDLKQLHPKEFIIREGKPLAGDIFFTLNKKDASLKKEGYLLNINNSISIEAPEAKGVFWGTRTLLQLLEHDKQHLTIPKGIAKDYPKFEVRGFVLDVGRKFFTIDFLRDYVRLMAYYKMNDFHIHLNDNGFKQFFKNNWDSTYSAFRLENSTYPGLTAKDGSYSKKEFIELQKLAERYGVTIIPEIDVPAHSLAFAKAVPGVGSDKYGKDHLDIFNPLTYQVVDNVFKEYLEGPEPVFRGKEVHIGTDEYAKAEAEKFREFTDHYIRYVEGFGKKVRLWGALTHASGNTPVKVKDVTLNAWYNGYADPKEMIKLGYDLISTPDGWLYIVPKAGYYYDYLNVKKIYNEWTPNMIGDQTFEEDHKQIRGGSFAVWNDHVNNGITEKDVHDRVFPAMQVLAQKMWDGTKAVGLVPYEEFLKQQDKIGEGPGLNMRGRIKGADSLIISYDFTTLKCLDNSTGKHNAVSRENIKLVERAEKKGILFKGGTSYVQTPIKGIGYGYTISFLINADAGNEADAVLFSSPDAVVKLKQQGTGKLGFSRENYNYHFNYSVPDNQWTQIVITGDNKGTSLYANGVLVEKLEGVMQVFTEKDKIAKVQTLFYPLQFIGGKKNSFKGCMADLKVFNKVLSPEEVTAMHK